MVSGLLSSSKKSYVFQYSKLSRSENLIKDLYCENADLMRSLQVTEDKFKASERKVAIQVEKNSSLVSLLRKVCPEAAHES